MITLTNKQITNLTNKIKLTPGIDCWEWVGYRSGGYGRFNVKGKPARAHRVTYHLWYPDFPIFQPKYLKFKEELDHLCRNRSCVAPYHLEIVDRKTHMGRSLVFREASKNNGLMNRKHNLPKGVSFNGKKFKARLWDGSKVIYLGTYETLEEASEVYKVARENLNE